ncbi:MAG: hypothetical protein ACXWWA_11575 [Chitinophagaceae bacterium]
MIKLFPSLQEQPIRQLAEKVGNELSRKGEADADKKIADEILRIL